MPPSLESTGSSKTSSNETPGLIHLNIFDGLSDSEKERQLLEMFISLNPTDIRLTLQTANGDVSLAIDELLNLEWLEQSGQRFKSVDGFDKSGDNAPSKKKKGKKKKAAKLASLKAVTSENPSEGANLSDAVHSDNITLISDRLNLAPSEVAGIYQQQNASPGATVVKIMDNYIALGLQPDYHLLSEVQEATDKFSWVPREYVKAIFEICSTQDEAIDIIGILADHFEKPPYLKYDISYRLVASYAEAAAMNEPVDASHLKTASKTFSNMLLPAIGSSRQPSTGLQAAAVASRSLAESTNHSYTSAAAAFKKGKSDPLFRQAGAYYADRAREQAASYQQASTIEANHLVDQNSAKDMIDLHGVTVQDGVQIARERVLAWWQGLGEERARKAKNGFTVITGLGRHSPDGKSRLRSNVFKALVADGWKAEVSTGRFVVTGRR
ncbi:hypothetical protein F4677DRAFT_255948 [Hypoxylon crocopeplum]|nr:hypothetical protein F4677DRAFT_255948 [Hypoxylon crocopeplum]